MAATPEGSKDQEDEREVDLSPSGSEVFQRPRGSEEEELGIKEPEQDAPPAEENPFAGMVSQKDLPAEAERLRLQAAARKANDERFADQRGGPVTILGATLTPEESAERFWRFEEDNKQFQEDKLARRRAIEGNVASTAPPWRQGGKGGTRVPNPTTMRAFDDIEEQR